MNLSTATNYAVKIAAWLQPHCERIEIAGSIRRRRPVCNDVDIVCIPKVREERDMLGEVMGRTNFVFQAISMHRIAGKCRIVSGGEKEGKQMIVELAKCQLDLWFASPKNFASRLLCRTGSKEHNVWLCEQAIAQGKKWNPYEGIEADGKILAAATEEDIYAALGLDWIEPERRDSEFLRKAGAART